MIKKDNISLFCFRCYHPWKKRTEARPKYCPKCKSPYWNKPRRKVSRNFVVEMQEMIINIHNAIIKFSGGAMGVRDEGGIYNSTYKLLNNQHKNLREPQSIGAFALNEFAKRHYFVDGNKRTAYAIAKIFMLINGCHLKVQYKEATHFIIEIAKYESKVHFEEIRKWLSGNCLPIEQKDLENYLNKAALNLMLGEE